MRDVKRDFFGLLRIRNPVISRVSEDGNRDVRDITLLGAP